MLNRFCPLRKIPYTPPAAVNGQHQDGWNANENQMKLKNTPSFTLYFKFCRYFLKNNGWYSHQIFYFLLFYISFYIREHGQKTFVMLSGFWLLRVRVCRRGRGGGGLLSRGLNESAEKIKMTKIFFTDKIQ